MHDALATSTVAAVEAAGAGRLGDGGDGGNGASESKPPASRDTGEAPAGAALGGAAQQGFGLALASVARCTSRALSPSNSSNHQ